MNIPRKQDDCRNTVINEKLKKNYDIGSGTINMEYYGSPRTNEQCKKIEELMDMLENRKPDSRGSFGSFFND